MDTIIKFVIAEKNIIIAQVFKDFNKKKVTSQLRTINIFPKKKWDLEYSTKLEIN